MGVIKKSSLRLKWGVIAAALALVASGGVVWATTRQAHAEPAALYSGQTIYSGGKMVSGDGHYTLIVQTDGNVVDYSWPRPLWSTATACNCAVQLEMQTDGNLVLYKSAGHIAVWASNTAGNPGAFVTLQTDANLVVRNASGVPIWGNGAVDARLDGGQLLNQGWQIQSSDRHYRMVMQSDGNLVVYDGNTPIWASSTNKAGSRTEMQSDGNLVVYDPSHIAQWASGTGGKNGAWLEAQTDGNFVLYVAPHTAIWSTKGSSGGGTISGTTAQLAKQILDLRAAGKINLIDFSDNKTRDTNDRSLASLQLWDMVAGKQAHLSERCSYAGQYTTYYGSDHATVPNDNVLKFLIDLSSYQKPGVNVLFGQCHTSVTSYHHQGKAVDLDCSWGYDVSKEPTKTLLAKADSIAAKYGMKRNSETCSGNQHWHYSVGGH